MSLFRRASSGAISPAIVQISIHYPPWMNESQRASYRILVMRRARQFTKEMETLGEQRPIDRR